MRIKKSNITVRPVQKLIQVLVVLLAIPVSVYLVQKATSYLLTARGEPARLVVNLSNTRLVSPGLWRNFSQGGEGDRADLYNIADKIAALEAEYVRIDHLYDRYDTVKLDSNQNLVFNWKGLDSEVEAILAAGARPFFSLSYFPPDITSGSELGLPANWAYWREIVRATVERYSGKNNKAIQGVYYEVWNEPDLFGNFKTYGAKNYLELYRQSALGALTAQNVLPFKFGGPATTAAYSNWFTGLLAFAAQNNLPLDFLSWHRYSYNLSDYESDVRTAKEALANFPRFNTTELIISELGVNSETDRAYDGTLSAIHTLATSAMLDQKVSKAFAFELQDGKGPQKYWGSYGLLTHKSFPPVDRKPRFWAHRFLNSIAGRHVEVSGEGAWVKAFARYDGKVLRILVANFDKEGKHTEAVPVRFIGLSDGIWSYKRKNFLGQERESKIDLRGGEFSTHELFPPNSAAILELEPSP